MTINLQAYDTQVDRKASRPPLARLFHVGQYVRCLIIDLQEGAVHLLNLFPLSAFWSPSPCLIRCRVHTAIRPGQHTMVLAVLTADGRQRSGLSHLSSWACALSTILPNTLQMPGLYTCLTALQHPHHHPPHKPAGQEHMLVGFRR